MSNFFPYKTTYPIEQALKIKPSPPDIQTQTVVKEQIASTCVFGIIISSNGNQGIRSAAKNERFYGERELACNGYRACEIRLL